MKRDSSSVTRGENVSGLTSSLTSKMSNENCGASDLLVEAIREGSSRSSSNLRHLDYVRTSKLDAAPLPEIDITEISPALVKYQTPHQSKSFPIPAANKYKSISSLRQISSPSSDPMKIFQRQWIVDSPRGSTMLLDSKSTITPSSSPDTENGKWLDLGLGSTCSQDTKHPNVNSGSVNFTEYCSPSVIKESNCIPLIPCPGIEKEADKNMDTSFLYTCNQQAYQNHITQAYSHFPYKLAESCSQRDVASFISSSSCDQPFMQKARFFSPHPQTRISQQPVVLQNSINRIQSQIPMSNYGDFAWSNTNNFGPITEPGISDILSRRKFLSEVQIGTSQYQRPQYSQPFLMFEPLQTQTAPQSTMKKSLNATVQTKDADIDKRTRSDAGLWFILQVAPTQDGDHALPQIPKTYLRIKDGTITILMVKKYIASKLGLKSESEIEITCKGKEMLPFFTLEQIRDKIWFSSFKKAKHSNNAEISCASSSPSLLSKQHFCHESLMILNYGRRATELR